MCADLPLFGVNLKILRYMGYIDHSDYRRAWQVSVVPFLNIALQGLNCCLVGGSFDQLVFNIFMFAILCNWAARITSIFLRQSKFSKITNQITEWYSDAEDEDILRLLLEINVKSGAFTKLTCCMALLAYIGALIHPLFMGKRSLIFEIHIPMVDVLATPYYQLAFALQACFVAPIAVSTFFACSNVIVAWLIFATGLLKHLRKKLESLNKLEGDELMEALKLCIKYHNRIISFRNDLESFLSPVCFIDIALFGLMLCVNLFYIALVDDLALKTIVSGFNMALLFTHFFTFWHANELSEQSLQIADTAFNIHWMRSNKRFGQCVVILIARSQKALQITAAGLYPMTLVSFQAIVRLSYSYFSLLQGLL